MLKQEGHHLPFCLSFYISLHGTQLEDDFQFLLLASLETDPQMLGPTLQGGQPEAQRACWGYELSRCLYLVAHPQHLHLGMPAVNLLICTLGQSLQN